MGLFGRPEREADSRWRFEGPGGSPGGLGSFVLGLVMAVAVQLGRKVITRIDDLAFVALAVIGVNVLHVPVLVVLAVVGALAIWWHRPRSQAPPPQAK